jgi:hypothetical protein
MTTSPRGAKRRYHALSAGIDLRQGAHQVAQMPIKQQLVWRFRRGRQVLQIVRRQRPADTDAVDEFAERGKRGCGNEQNRECGQENDGGADCSVHGTDSRWGL